jgi:hypothetical protein
MTVPSALFLTWIDFDREYEQAARLELEKEMIQRMAKRVEIAQHVFEEKGQFWASKIPPRPTSDDDE